MTLFKKNQQCLSNRNKNIELETNKSCSRRNFLRYLFETLLIASFLPLTGARPSKDFASSRKRKDDLSLRFAIISDGHWGKKSSLGDYRENFETMVYWLNEEQADKGLDLVIFNGDIINNGPHQLSEAKAVLDKLNVRLYVSKGNHDRVDDETWEQVWGTPPNHDFEIDDYAFIIANTSDIHGNYLCPDRNWINQRLTHYADRKHVFLVMHICPSGLGKKSKTCPEVTDCIEQYENLAAAFYAHDHYSDGHRKLNGVHYFWDGRFGAMGGVGYKGYRIVEDYSDGTILSYQYDRAKKHIVNTTTILPKFIAIR